MRPLVAIAQSATQVLLIRVADRVGKGIRNSPRDALIADSVDPAIRGRAFGFNRTGDNAGGVLGPLIAFALLQVVHLDLRTRVLAGGDPGCAAVRRGARSACARSRDRSRGRRRAVPWISRSRLARASGRVLGVILLFTLGNSTDAFLLLRAKQLGVPVALAPILWALLHVVKSVSSIPGGALSDRIGRKPRSSRAGCSTRSSTSPLAARRCAWHAWALFGVYGIFFGLTEGTERALVADLVPAARRGTAFGWYNLAIGLGALPASILFGALWDRFGSRVAFDFGAALALAASLGIASIPILRARPSTAARIATLALDRSPIFNSSAIRAARSGPAGARR